MRLITQITQHKIARELDQWVKKLKCSGSSGIGIESFPDIKVGVDPSPVKSEVPNYDPCHEDSLARTVIPVINSEEILLENGDRGEGSTSSGLRPGLWELSCHSRDIESIKGEYKDGKLNGKAKILFKQKHSIDGYFKDGVLHGFARYFDKKGRLTFVGNHKNGLPAGICWAIIRGGGCVVGRVDGRGTLTGEGIAYIYPDYVTALVGSFTDGVMESGQEAVIIGSVEDEAGIKVPVFSEPDGYLHVQQQRNQFGLDPTVRDPYESKMVEVCRSAIDRANEGLFARVDIEVNTIIAFYNGSQTRPEDYDPDTWETNNYKIFDHADMPDGTIDIPDWAQSSSAYCATLAHKTNHSFLPNGQFVVFEHPKYGLIPCIATIADIQQGEEVKVAYGYDWKEAPDWYKLAWGESNFYLQGVEYDDWMDCNVKYSVCMQTSAEKLIN